MKKERYVTNSGAELDETHRPLRGQKWIQYLGLLCK
jgi:hypothetical protein